MICSGIGRKPRPVLGETPNVLTQEQSDFSGVKVEGPFKGGDYTRSLGTELTVLSQ